MCQGVRVLLWDVGSAQPLSDGEAIEDKSCESQAGELVEDGLQKMKEITTEKQSLAENYHGAPCLRGVAAPGY